MYPRTEANVILLLKMYIFINNNNKCTKHLYNVYLISIYNNNFSTETYVIRMYVLYIVYNIQRVEEQNEY